VVGVGEAEEVVIALEKVGVVVALTILLENATDPSRNMLVKVGSGDRHSGSMLHGRLRIPQLIDRDQRHILIQTILANGDDKKVRRPRGDEEQR
jgi:hypothetical protein